MSSKCRTGYCDRACLDTYSESRARCSIYISRRWRKDEDEQNKMGGRAIGGISIFDSVATRRWRIFGYRPLPVQFARLYPIRLPKRGYPVLTPSITGGRLASVSNASVGITKFVISNVRGFPMACNGPEALAPCHRGCLGDVHGVGYA